MARALDLDEAHEFYYRCVVDNMQNEAFGIHEPENVKYHICVGLHNTQTALQNRFFNSPGIQLLIASEKAKKVR